MTVYVRGTDPKDSSTGPAKQDVKRMKAGAVITAGSAVVLDVTDANAETVIASTLALAAHGITVGIYDGYGGTGVTAAASGLTGVDAVTGDWIRVVKNGVVACRAYFNTTTNSLTAGIMRMTPGTTAGTLCEATVASQWEATLWAARTTVTTGATVVITARVAFR